VWRLPVPLPGHGIGRVNCYVLEDEGRLLLIDTGYAVDEGRAALQAMLQRIGHGVDRLDRILVTHLHADHCGLAAWLQGKAGATVAMHPADAARLRDRYVQQAPVRAATAAWLDEVGAPEAGRDLAQRQVTRWSQQFDDLGQVEAIEDGQVVEHGSFRLEAIHTPGHTPGHLCFFEKRTRTMFTGDTVLPRITYSPTYRPFPSTDPIAQYRSSLARLARYPTQLALPGHQDPFKGLGARIADLDRHHRRRSDHVRAAALAGGPTAWEIASELPRSRPWSAVRPAGQLSAVGEVYAYLIALQRVGAVSASSDLPLRWTADEASLGEPAAS